LSFGQLSTHQSIIDEVFVMLCSESPKKVDQ